MQQKETWYNKITPYIKDAIYIIGIGVSIYGWISSKGEAKATLETTIKYNTDELKKVELFMDKQVELNSKQAGINGILLEFKNEHMYLKSPAFSISIPEQDTIDNKIDTTVDKKKAAYMEWLKRSKKADINIEKLNSQSVLMDSLLGKKNKK
jgi:hypothetical protein